MALVTGVGISLLDALDEACQQAVEAAIRDAGDASALSGVVCLPTSGYGPDPVPAAIAKLRRSLPDSVRLAGSCVGGFVYGETRVDGFLGGQRGVIAIVIGGAKVAAAFEGETRDAGHAAGVRAGESVCKQLGASPDSLLVFVPGFPEDNGAASNAFVSGLAERLPSASLSGGGSSCGLGEQGETLRGYSFVDDQISLDAAVVVALGGGVRSATGFNNALESIKALGALGGVAGPAVAQIGDQPAVDAFLSAFDASEQALLRNNPMVGCMELGAAFARYQAEANTYWPFTTVAFLPDNSLIALPIGLSSGDEVEAVRISPEAVLSAVDRAGAMIRDASDNATQELVISHSCAMRDFHLGPRAAEEEEHLQAMVSLHRHVKILAVGEVASTGSTPPVSRFTSYAFSAIGWAGS